MSDIGPLVRARCDHAIATLQLEFAGTLSPDTVARTAAAAAHLTNPKAR
jgi:hypothetical protein